jgi:anthranilate synthase component 1
VNIYPNLDQLSGLARQGYTLLPVGIQIPADTLTPVSAFLRLRATSSQQTFLLESADGGEAIGRYSYLGIDPFASLVSQQGQLTFTDFITGAHESVPTTFDAIGRFLRRFDMPRIAGLPAFIGGAMGYYSYDAVKYLEKIPSPAGGFYAPYEARFFFFRTILAFDRLTHQLFLVRLIPGGLKDLKQKIDEAVGELVSVKKRLAARADLEEMLEVSLTDLGRIAPEPCEPLLGEARYTAAVQQIKAHIRQGDIFQCVLADRFRFKLEADPFLVYRMLRMINPSPYLYYLGFDDETLLGSSPEMLLRTEGRLVETAPIAGTRPRGGTAEEDRKREKELMASVKERAEHLMLVDLGRNDIGRVSRSGSVKVARFMDVERYSHVMHIVSQVQGELKRPLTPWDAFGAAFPAGTLTGAPKIRAMQIISGLEDAQRGPYGGAVVAQDFAGDLNSCITIRSLYVRDGIGYAQAGAGIVADSKAQNEYQEVLNKVKVVRAAAALAHKLTRKTP